MPPSGPGSTPHAVQAGSTASAARSQNSAGCRAPKPWPAHGMPQAAAATGPAKSVTSWITRSASHPRITLTRSATFAGAATSANIRAPKRQTLSSPTSASASAMPAIPASCIVRSCTTSGLSPAGKAGKPAGSTTRRQNRSAVAKAT